MIKIYMDNCCFNRPYDDQEQIRIRLESEAKLEIQSRIKDGHVFLSWSFMLDYENSCNIDSMKQNEIAKWGEIAQDYFIGSEQTVKIAREIMHHGIKNKDAVHLACAIETGCDYFLTTDDGILRKKDAIDRVVIVNPMDFLIIMEGER